MRWHPPWVRGPPAVKTPRKSIDNRGRKAGDMLLRFVVKNIRNGNNRSDINDDPIGRVTDRPHPPGNVAWAGPVH